MRFGTVSQSLAFLRMVVLGKQLSCAPTDRVWANPKPRARPVWFLWHHSGSTFIHIPEYHFSFRNYWVFWLNSPCSPQKPHGNWIGIVVLSFQLKKRHFWEIKSLPQSHTTIKYYSQDLGEPFNSAIQAFLLCFFPVLINFKYTEN